MAHVQGSPRWRIGDVEVDLQARQVLSAGVPMPLGSRAFDVLAVLIESRGEVVPRKVLLERAWPGLHVEPNNLTVQISALRKTLGADLVVTAGTRGYQLGCEPLPEHPASGAAIAVLPFEAFGLPDRLPADGLTEDLISALGRFRSLRVISRNSSYGVVTAGRTLPAVARELGARFIVEGSVRAASPGLRIVAGVYDGHADRQCWSETYFRDAGRLPGLQEELAGALASAIQPQVDLAERSGAPRVPADATAYGLALSAWAMLRRHDSGDGRARREGARALARQALAIDPLSSLAARTVAWSWFSELFLARTEAHIAAAREAVELLTRITSADPLDHHAYHHRGLLFLVLQEPLRAREDLARAHDLNPNDPATLAFLGSVEASCGNPARGESLARLAISLSPRDPQRYLLHNQLAWCLFAGGKDLAALEHARQAAVDAPWFPAAWAWIAVTAQSGGDIAVARQAVDRLASMAPGYLASRLAGEWLGADRGYRERATSLLRQAAGGAIRRPFEGEDPWRPPGASGEPEQEGESHGFPPSRE